MQRQQKRYKIQAIETDPPATSSTRCTFNHPQYALDYCYLKLTNQIASLEVTIRDSYLARGNYSDACEPLSHASVVTRCPANQNATPNCVRVRAQ